MSSELCSRCLEEVKSDEFQEVLHGNRKEHNWEVVMPTFLSQAGICNLCDHIVYELDNDVNPVSLQLHEHLYGLRSWQNYEYIAIFVSASLSTSGTELDLKFLKVDVGFPSTGPDVGNPIPRASRFRLTSFRVFTPSDDEASIAVSGRPVIGRVDCEPSFAQTRLWLRECHHNHDSCRRSTPAQLPTRVLDVSREQCHLHCSTPGETGMFAVLSYCWGGKQPLMLTSQNLHTYVANMNMSMQPKTIQDAIKVTRQLGIQYLWIDALCIIQDNRADKHKEIRNMRNIFGSSHLTIIAAGAPTVMHGFLQDRPDEDELDIKLPYCVDKDGSVAQGTIHLRDLTRSQYDYRKNPTESRAWCFEEKLLPVRRLIYGAEDMRWQCETLQEAHGGFVDSRISDRAEFLAAPLRRRKSDSSVIQWDAEVDQREQYSLQVTWRNLVQDYSSRQVTHKADRQLAILALAEIYQHATGDTYLAGMWRSQLNRELLWKREVDESEPEARPDRYTAPSWSWASIDGPIYMPSGFSRGIVSKVLHCSVTPVALDMPLGPIVSGILVLRSRVRVAAWSPLQGTLYQLQDESYGGFLPKHKELQDDDIHQKIGKAPSDAFEADPYRLRFVLCLSLTTCDFLDHAQQGLVLNHLPSQNKDIYRRVALFSIGGPSDPLNCDCSDEGSTMRDGTSSRATHTCCSSAVEDWFKDAIEREITII